MSKHPAECFKWVSGQLRQGLLKIDSSPPFFDSFHYWLGIIKKLRLLPLFLKLRPKLFALDARLPLKFDIRRVFYVHLAAGRNRTRCHTDSLPFCFVKMR